MSDSIEVYRRSHEAAEKLDYFICGVAGALFAYIGQNYIPRKLEFGISLLEPLALIFLAGAFFAGLKRIEVCSAQTSINHDQLKLNDEAKELIKLIGPSLENKDLFQSQPDRNIFQTENLKKLLNKVYLKNSRYYKLRNRLLALGFGAIFLSKLLSPYAGSLTWK